jgi:hypothetical protein
MDKYLTLSVYPPKLAGLLKRQKKRAEIYE